jgi:hypothetical protein
MCRYAWFGGPDGEGPDTGRQDPCSLAPATAGAMLVGVRCRRMGQHNVHAGHYCSRARGACIPAGILSRILSMLLTMEQ